MDGFAHEEVDVHGNILAKLLIDEVSDDAIIRIVVPLDPRHGPSACFVVP